MNKKQWLRGFIGLLSVGVVSLSVLNPARASDAPQVTCVRHKQVTNWTNTLQLEARGFFREVFSPEASLGFGQDSNYKYLSLNVAATPQFSGQYVASRITEIDTSVSADQRVKCWQPTANEDVVAEFAVRFDQSVAPFGLTENMFLWNAPFGQNPIPLTAVGVTRSLDLTTNQPTYSAIMAQDLVFDPTFSGSLQTAPMPVWLDASAWHLVRVTVSQQDALIEVSQGVHPFTPVLQSAFVHPPEPLGFEFSVDNEIFPGVLAPVTTPDSLHVGEFDLELAP
jgi:hypothetical protein